MFEINDDGPTPDQWVDTLIADARESASAVVRETDQQAADVAELGGLVTHLAKTIGRMAETVQRTHAAATDTKHAVTAADWFWRKVKAVVSVPRKLAAGGACLACCVGGHAASPKSLPIGNIQTDAPVSVPVVGVTEDAATLWRLSQSKKVEGDELTAALLLNRAADMGHPTAVLVMNTRDNVSPRTR